MKVLVTGAAGFIGSHLCDKLIELGHEVLGVDNLTNGNIENIRHLILNDRFKFLKLDINKLNVRHLEGVTHVSHQAAIGSVPRSIESPELYHQSNTSGFFNVLNLAKQLGVKRFVYASSSSVYGSNTDMPKVEDKTGYALSPYAVTKQMNELYANIFTLNYQMECIGLRYFNVFGPRQKPEGQYAAVIPKFVSLLLDNQPVVINGDGSYARDFTYIENVVQANILALTTTNSECFGEAFNIGAGQETSITQLVEHITAELGTDSEVHHGPFRAGDIPKSVASIAKANKYLRYSPEVNVQQGLKRTIGHLKTKHK